MTFEWMTSPNNPCVVNFGKALNGRRPRLRYKDRLKGNITTQELYQRQTDRSPSKAFLKKIRPIEEKTQGQNLSVARVEYCVVYVDPISISFDFLKAVEFIQLMDSD